MISGHQQVLEERRIIAQISRLGNESDYAFTVRTRGLAPASKAEIDLERRLIVQADKLNPRRLRPHRCTAQIRSGLSSDAH